MTSLVFEKLAQSLAANQAWPLQIAGDFFRIESCDWPVTIEIMNGGRVVGRMTNVRAGDFVRDAAFDQVRIINGATAQFVTVQIAGGGVGSDRIIGEVAVIDGGRARSMFGSAFMGWVAQAASVGLYSHCQLWNPVGSGRRLVVEQVICASATATGFVHLSATAALANLNGYGRPKRFGLANSVAEIKREALAAEGGNRSLLTNSPVMTSNFFVPREPVVLDPGYGYSVTGQGVNQDCSVSFEWFEEAIV